MTDAPSPFDDPEFVEMLKRSGVTHRPGMAQELMDEIGPLLAADGFDMENPDQDVDLENLNAAMGRAVERRNMELVTPVGAARALTVALLREFVNVYTAEDRQLLDSILGRLRPDPTPRHPSFSHLIGVALEKLDAWYSDEALRAALTRLPSADTPAEVRPAISDLEALARKGRAFRSIERLLVQHNGAILAAASAYLVAVTVAAVTAHRQQPVGLVLGEMLSDESSSGGFGTGTAFGAAAAQQVSAQDQLGQFENWLLENEDLAMSAPEDIEVFETIVDSAALWNLDPFDADDFEELIDMVLQLEDSSVAAWSLAVLHDYVHFRLEGDDARSWEEAHEIINDIAGDTASLPPQLQTLLDGLEDIPAEERYAAVVSTPLITGIARLQEWIGKSQPVTGTGMPKRADIGVVAAMIGIDAEGVTNKPPVEVSDEALWNLDLSKPAPPQPTLQVQSAKDIGALRAWWAALEIHAGIELTSTRVYPGAMTEILAAPQIEDLEPVEMFIVSYIREYLLGETDQYFGNIAVRHTVGQLLSLAEVSDIPSAEDPFSAFSIRHLRNFESMGLLEIRESQLFIPEPLRPVVVLGAMLAMTDLELAQ
ncbi:MAG: hypothetical protein HLX51_09475 [Micrococcaceae bacterium]|nr:hypothetical protein [Micrococcaceae bacterium]